MCDTVRVPIARPVFQGRLKEIGDTRHVAYLWLVSRVSPKVKIYEILILGQSCPVSQELTFLNVGPTYDRLLKTSKFCLLDLVLLHFEHSFLSHSFLFVIEKFICHLSVYIGILIFFL